MLQPFCNIIALRGLGGRGGGALQVPAFLLLLQASGEKLVNLAAKAEKNSFCHKRISLQPRSQLSISLLQELHCWDLQFDTWLLPLLTQIGDPALCASLSTYSWRMCADTSLTAKPDFLNSTD